MVLIVRGAALWGIDLSAPEIEIERGLVRLQLPAPRVIDAWVDVEGTHTWARESGRFRSADMAELEAEMWSAAQQLVREGANHRHHLDEARLQAERIIREILRAVDPAIALEVSWTEAPINRASV